MEDLYSNLDNYDEVNVIDELRNENKNLKLKVDEYAIAMEKLQKDFDILSSEFKRLEINYSSLLKTARAEVERKTQIITNLNMEKDMLVIKSLQNGNKSLLNIRRNMTKNKITTNKTRNNKNNESDSSKSNKNTSRDNSAKLKDFSSERLEENIRPSADTSRNSKTDNSKLVNKPIENVESCSDRNSDAKEINTHHKDGYEGSVSAQSGSIKHRRKSMLAFSVQDEKFSTDEEWDTDFITKEQSSKEYSSRNEYSSKKIERDINEKQNRKYSDPPNIDDKFYSSHESSRETRKSRNYRNYDGDKYRCQDKYEYSRKSWRHTSPDRSHRKPPGDYHDGHNQRSGYRNRVLESPDKYSDYKRKTREHRMNSERNHPPMENGNKRHYQSEKQTNKYKMSSDYDEPSNKRVRTNSFHRRVEEDDNKRVRTNSFHRHVEEDDNKRVRTNSFHRHVEEDDNKRVRTNSYHRNVEEEDGWYDDINSIDNGAFSETYPDLRSCQSPDFLYSDLQQQSNHQIKEIKHTAATQLEDPRMTSKKYVVKSDDEKVTLCTAVGRNVNIELINKSKWNIQRVDIPQLLVQRPIEVQRTKNNETLVKEIYMDIDIENPVSNLSLESGEIYFGPEKVPDSMTKYHKDVENGGRCEKVGDLIQKAEDPPKVLSTGYKIPKIGHCAKEPNSYNTGDIDNYLSHKPKSIDMIKDDNEKINTKDLKKKPEILDCHDNLIKNIKDAIHYVNQQDLQKKCIISNRQIVEGDLELSDEASDNIELHQFVRKDIEKHTLYNPKQCKNDNIDKDNNTENVESLQETSQPNKNKEINLVDKDHKTIPKKQYQSSIFDIEHVNEMEENADNNKSKGILKIDESLISFNKNEKHLSMLDIQPSELEIKEKVNNDKNKEKKLLDKKQKSHKKNVPEEETNTKNIVDKKPKTKQSSKPHTSKIDDQHYVDHNDVNLEIKNTVNGQTTCQMNVSETLIGIKKHVEEIKEKANTDKNQKSNENNKNRTAELDIQLSAEEIKDKSNKNNDIKLSNKNNKCNQKQEDQSMKEVEITEQPTSLTQQQEKEIKDKCDKNKEMQIAGRIDQRQTHPFKKDKKNVKKIDKSDKSTEVNETQINRKTDKNIEIIEVNEKNSEHIKSKTKKKSHKLKETQKKESLADTESPQVTAKRKSKKEKDKPKEIKNKFTDLFGDSCSLITPEELGINSGPVETILKSSNINLPIFEDAQDAIDLKELTKVQQAPTIDVALDKESPSCMTDLESNTKQNATACKVDVQSQDNEVQYVSGEIVKVNENVNLEPSPKENDVVKTIIISTGIQPGSLGNNKPEIRHDTVNIAANTQTNYNVMLKSREFSLKALATSTPHKDVHDRVLEPDPRVPCIDNSIQMSEQSDTNTLDSQTDVDTDVPDVRIFVRRRRKIIKKSTT